MNKRLQNFVYNFASRWFVNDGFGLAAAFSFYTIFAIAPMLAFGVALSTYFLGGQQADEGVARWLENYMSPGRSRALVELLQVEQWGDLNWVYTGLTGVVFIWGASLAFVRLRIAVNILLGNEADSIRHAIRNSVSGRLMSILFTLVMGLVTAFFVVLTTGASGLAQWVSATSGGALGIVVEVLSFLFFSIAIIAIMRLLPDAPPSWRASFIAMTFVLVTVELGRRLFLGQLSNSQFATAYGAANALVIFLIWVFYCAQALLLGVNLGASFDEVVFTDDDDA